MDGECITGLGVREGEGRAKDACLAYIRVNKEDVDRAKSQKVV